MASQNIPRPPEKISADCPHCGFSQLESPHAKSTFCRKCGQHYTIEKLLGKEVTSLKGPSIFDKLSKMVSGEKINEATCFSCGHKHEVSSSAQSTFCPQCGSYIDLRDFRIAGPFGRSIQTQGEVIITSKGEVTNGKVGCGTAFIEGKLRSNLECTGVATVRVNGKVFGAIDAQQLVIDRKADVDFVRPVKARAAEINGKMAARVFCDGCVTVTKTGNLRGEIHARSINIERGGIFSGELFIGQPEPPEPEPLTAPDDDIATLGADSLRFGSG